MYKHAKINLTGVMPDGIIPNKEVTQDVGLDYVFIYYRTDGNLYLYDTALKREFNLFNLPSP